MTPRPPWKAAVVSDRQSPVCSCPGSRAGQSGAGVKPGNLSGAEDKAAGPLVQEMLH